MCIRDRQIANLKKKQKLKTDTVAALICFLKIITSWKNSVINQSSASHHKLPYCISDQIISSDRFMFSKGDGHGVY